MGFGLTALLLITLLAWLYVRRLLQPLDTIGEGARRFGSGNFSQPLPQRNAQASGELGELAMTINTMAKWAASSAICWRASAWPHATQR
jgi:HAMP domain-containing protein